MRGKDKAEAGARIVREGERDKELRERGPRDAGRDVRGTERESRGTEREARGERDAVRDREAGRGGKHRDADAARYAGIPLLMMQNLSPCVCESGWVGACVGVYVCVCVQLYAEV